MELVKLEEAIEGILDSIVDTLKDSKISTSVVRGDRHRTTPKAPALWVYGLAATPDHSRRSFAEVWNLEVSIVAIVKNDTPEDGYREATTLAAKGRSEVLKDRSLGNRNYVQDTKSGRFEPGGPNMQKDTLFAATAMLQVTFIILEQNP